MATSYADSAQNDDLVRRLNKKETSHLRRDFDPDLFHEYDAQAVAERDRDYRKGFAHRKAITMSKMEARLEEIIMCQKCDELLELVERQIEFIGKSSDPSSGFCEGVIQSVLHIGGINQGESLELTRRAHEAEEARRKELQQLGGRAS